MKIILLSEYTPEFRGCLWYPDHVLDLHICTTRAVWSASLTSEGLVIENWPVVKNQLSILILGKFFFPDYIFTFTTLMSILLLLEDTLKLRGYLWYPNHVFGSHIHTPRAVLSASLTSEAHKSHKGKDIVGKEKFSQNKAGELIFYDSSIFNNKLFWGQTCTSNNSSGANVYSRSNTWSGYQRHPLNSGVYSDNIIIFIQGVEVKISSEKQNFYPIGLKEKCSLHRTVASSHWASWNARAYLFDVFFCTCRIVYGSKGVIVKYDCFVANVIHTI